MKKSTFILGMVLLSITGLVVQSCGSEESTVIVVPDGHDNSDGHHDEDKENDHDSDTHSNATKTGKSELMKDYLALKTALTKDDEKQASSVAITMGKTIKGFDKNGFTGSDKTEVREILETALEHAEHIANSPISHQREHFKKLSIDMIDLLAITGNETKLYQQFCPMYDNNRGASWLSADSKIENPYYGSKMFSCGKVEKEH
jgi:hypothetical protein